MGKKLFDLLYVLGRRFHRSLGIKCSVCFLFYVFPFQKRRTRRCGSLGMKCSVRFLSSAFPFQNDRTNETLLGSLDLVDLAGSERIKESGSTGNWSS